VHQVRAVHGEHAGRDVLHGQLLVGHDELIELNAQHPRRDAREIDLLIGHLVVGAHEVVILGHDGHLLGGRVDDRIVPDLRAQRDRAQRRELEERLHVFGGLRVGLVLILQVDGERGRLGPFGHVDDLFEAWHADSHVLGGDTRVVERVQRHLRRRLADGLRRERAHHLARAAAVLQESLLHLAQHPFESLG